MSRLVDPILGTFSLFALLCICHAEPTITSVPGTVAIKVGSTAVLVCNVQDLGSEKVTWTFISHDIIIFEGNRLKTDDLSKYSLLYPDQFSHSLMVLGVEETDQGFYRCSVGQSSIIWHLDVIGTDNLPVPTSDKINVTDCCIEENVSESCLPACYPPDIDLDVFDIEQNCGMEMDIAALSVCLADGSNHDTCCLYSGVLQQCLSLCHSRVPADVNVTQECFSDTQINAMLSCAVLGQDLFPSAPTSVGVLAVNSGSPSILVKWYPPEKNAQAVTGYKIMYKKVGETSYESVVLHDPSVRQYRLTKSKDYIVADQGYFVHVVALAEHGISLGSLETEIYVPSDKDGSLQQQSIDDCCLRRGIGKSCRESMCQAKTWSEFDTGSALDCIPFLDDVFTCLAGERNHTNCCSAFDITSECLPLCSGAPPSFDNSLLGCVAQMGVIEGCIQLGLKNQPAPPTNLEVDLVTNELVQIRFTGSTSSDILRYRVEIKRESGGTDPFLEETILPQVATSFQLQNLMENTYYSVRIVAETVDAGSLPSETVSFLTYSDSYSEPVEIPDRDLYNFTECCAKSGMPDVCVGGCVYRTDMTSYYSDKLMTCGSSIGDVLRCASDGRDHRSCCSLNEIDNRCLDLCVHTTPGPLDHRFLPHCVSQTAIAVSCYMEGVVDLPRHPDVMVKNVSAQTINLAWDHPPSGSDIDRYRIRWRVVGSSVDMAVNDQTDKLGFIIQDLSPNTAYVINVFSINANGTSAPSPSITVYTLKDDDLINPAINISDDSAGRAFWSNITDCCANTVSATCQDACLNKELGHDVESTCFDDSLSIIACYTDGGDHRECCTRKGLPSECVPICGGNAGDMSVHQATCMSYTHKDMILSCYMEKQGLLPGSPLDFTAKRSTQTDLNVTLSWVLPGFCSDCYFNVFYYDEENKDNVWEVKTSENDISIEVPEQNKRYTFMVVAHNSYGGGPPSSKITLNMVRYERDIKVYLDGNAPLVVQGQDAYLVCSISGFPDTIKNLKKRWLFNNRKTVGYDPVLRIRDVDAAKHEGTYTCEVTDYFTTSSASFFLPVKAKPVFDQLKNEAAAPGQGFQGKVACWFRGFPDTGKLHWWKDNTLLQEVPAKITIGQDIRYHSGITSYRVKIADLVESDYGVYSISVSNQFGSAQCHVRLANPNNNEVPSKIPYVSNPQECCKKYNMSEICQELCGYHVNIEEILGDVKYSSCLRHFDNYITCGADGRDHTKCCQEKAVTPFCQPMCRSVVPGNVLTDQLQLLVCLADWQQIMTCMKEGVTNIPFAPLNLEAKSRMEGTMLALTWRQPLALKDKVDHYTIYYRPIGSNTTKHLSTNVKSYNIQNLKAFTTYEIWMKSGNQYGESLPTDVYKVETYSSKPYNVEATPKPEETKVLLTWAVKGAYLSFSVHYREYGSRTWITVQPVTDKGVTLSNLKPSTTYDAFVVTKLENGVSGLASSHIRFTTFGGNNKGPTRADPSKDKNTVAIAVGATVAIIAIIAIIVLVLFFIFKSRITAPPVNDRVAFENPRYGSPGQVKIQGLQEQQGFSYGQLNEDNGDMVAAEGVYQNNNGNTAMPVSNNTMQDQRELAFDNTGFVIGEEFGNPSFVNESSTDPTDYENPMYSLAESRGENVATLQLDDTSSSP